jgi:hypothetical protein
MFEWENTNRKSELTNRLLSILDECSDRDIEAISNALDLIESSRMKKGQPTSSSIGFGDSVQIHVNQKGEEHERFVT